MQFVDRYLNKADLDADQSFTPALCSISLYQYLEPHKHTLQLQPQQLTTTLPLPRLRTNLMLIAIRLLVNKSCKLFRTRKSNSNTKLQHIQSDGNCNFQPNKDTHSNGDPPWARFQHTWYWARAGLGKFAITADWGVSYWTPAGLGKFAITVGWLLDIELVLAWEYMQLRWTGLR